MKNIFRSIDAMVGNLIFRITGDDSMVDYEWNRGWLRKQLAMPDKKSWVLLLILIVGVPLITAVIFIIISLV